MVLVNNVVLALPEKRCDDVLSTGIRYMEKGTEDYRMVGLQLISASSSSCRSCDKKEKCEAYMKAMEMVQAQSL